MNQNSLSDSFSMTDSPTSEAPGEARDARMAQAPPGAGDRAERAHTDLPPQLHGYLLRLAAQSDRMQAQLDRLVAEAEQSGSQVSALTRHLTDPTATQPMHERLADLLARMEASQTQLEDLATTVAKLSRTQFRSNALAEIKEQQIATALATLQEIATRREQAQEARQSQEEQRLADLRAEARGELAVELLSVLDGLELALDNGRALLERRRRRVAPAAASAETPGRGESHSLWQRLRQAFVAEPQREEQPLPPEPPDEMSESLAAWLRGLELVRERFLTRLAGEGIQPVHAVGQPFDPRQHLAVGTEPRDDVPPGTVVGVLRKGYRQRERVLRYAEVVASRAREEHGERAENQGGEGNERGREDLGD